MKHGIIIKSKDYIVFQQINNLKMWKNWSPFTEDTTMVSIFEGPEEGIGAIWRWESKMSGNGSMTIIESVPNENMVSELDFGKNGRAIDTWTFENIPEGIKVTWNLEAKDLNYPLGRFMGMFMERAMDDIFVKGLKKLKSTAESMKPQYSISEIAEKNLPSQWNVVIRISGNENTIGAKIEESYGQLAEYLGKNKIDMAGAPFAIYPQWVPDAENLVIAGFPIAKKTQINAPFELYEIPATKVVFATHKGPYSTTFYTHQLIDQYIKDHGKEKNGYVWEVYLTDPIAQPDSTQYESQIFYPVK